MDARPALSVDIGGTKTLVALVVGERCLEIQRFPTDRAAGPEAWLDAVVERARIWSGRFDAAAVAASGLVREGRWSSLNPVVLPIPAAFPLEEELGRRLGTFVAALNDAQAAAWGEYRFGAGRGSDLVFITISTGVGGGIVANGRLLTGARGLAGHIGRMPIDDRADGERVEDLASGGALARQAVALGHGTDAVGVFRAAVEGQPWAETLIARCAERIAVSIASLQMVLDPGCFILGGGVGLAPGFVERVRAALADMPEPVRPVVRPAALGAEAGLLGAADYARMRWAAADVA